MTAADVAALPGLRIVAVASAGYDHLDVPALATAGVQIAHAPGYCDVEVADHALAMTLALLRNLHVGDRYVRDGGWSSRAVGAKRVTGSVLGVVGLGRTGALVARRASALGLRVIAWAPRTQPARAGSSAPPWSRRCPNCWRPATWCRCTCRSPPRPRTSSTPTRWRSCARTRPWSTAAAAAWSTSARCGRRWSPAAWRAPPSTCSTPSRRRPDHIAFTLPRTILTPHQAWLSAESEYAAYEMAAEALAAVLCGRPPLHAVEKQS